MNTEEIRRHAAQGRIRWEPTVGFTIDGALVTDEADHVTCRRVLGMAESIAPFLAGDLVKPAAHLIADEPADEPEPEREPMSGVVLPTIETFDDGGAPIRSQSTEHVIVPDEAPAVDAAREESTPPPPDPEED